MLSSSLARDALALAEAISLSHTLAAAVIKTHSPSKTRKRARGWERRGEVTTTTTTTAENETGRVVSRSLSHSLELATETKKKRRRKNSVDRGSERLQKIQNATALVGRRTSNDWLGRPDAES